MALTLGAVAVGLATPPVGQDEGTGQAVRRDPEAGQKSAFALPQPSGLGAFWFDLHLSVIIHTDY